MKYKTKVLKAVTNSTLLRKKKISSIKSKKLKQINLKLKLHMYKMLPQSLKYISVNQNYKFNFNINSLLY